MKKLILGSVAVLMAVAALADVPRGRPGRGDGDRGRPGNEGPVEHTPISYVNNIDGDEAEILYLSSNVAEKRMNLVRANTTNYYKVIRSADGLYQVVCLKSASRVRGEASYRCETEKSANGEKLETYKPPVQIRRG